MFENLHQMNADLLLGSLPPIIFAEILKEDPEIESKSRDEILETIAKVQKQKVVKTEVEKTKSC